MGVRRALAFAAYVEPRDYAAVSEVAGLARMIARNPCSTLNPCVPSVPSTKNTRGYTGKGMHG